ncbi:hypothetical protein CONLIGDRAFT_673904 [Coniochaeta ligniaria NRRL 30616]|uniref:Uncharacterized protein n=1 Tax=Coniochaeta ligniaria NRRL 30616 TaxID=1408157 RepID=A0A1J7J4Z0_9PEZI|nr:hypothetical protein CONLIGDRAFT_673904 [Coniochaeta ligniaria NRRL 30616]
MASHNNTRLFGTPVSGVTSRTVFRWTDGHNALFEAFVRTPEWTEVVPKTMVQLDSLVRDLGLTPFMGQTNAAGKVLGPIIQTKVLSKCYTVARALPAVERRVPQVERAAEHTPLPRVVEVVDVNLPLGRRYPPVQYPELPLPADDYVEPNIHSIRRSAPARAPAPAGHQRQAQDVPASVAPAHRRPPEAADLQPHNRNNLAGPRAPQARVLAQVEDDLHVARGVPLAERPAPARAPAPQPRLRPSQLVAANTPVPRHAPLLGHQARPQAENPFLQPPGNRAAQRHRPVEGAVSFQPRQTNHIGVPAQGRVPFRPPPYIEEEHPHSGPPVSPPPHVRPNQQRPPLAHHRPPNNLAPPNPPHLPPCLDLRPGAINPVTPAMAPLPLQTTPPPPPPRGGGAQHIIPREEPFPSSPSKEDDVPMEPQRGGSKKTKKCLCGRDAVAAAPGPTVLQPHMTVYYVEGRDERWGGGRKKKEKKGRDKKRGGKKGGKERCLGDGLGCADIEGMDKHGDVKCDYSVVGHGGDECDNCDDGAICLTLSM